MIRSMTGYGRKESTCENGGRLTVEMRAVNHRFCELVVRLPKAYAMLEDHVKKVVAQKVLRGRVEIMITLEQPAAADRAFSVDWELAEQYVQAARQLNVQFSLKDPLTAKDILSFPGVIGQEEENFLPVEDVAEWLIATVQEATGELLRMKEAEGAHLQTDIEQRLVQIEGWAEEIRQLAPQSVQEYRERLRQRISEWQADIPLAFEQQRIAQEIALFAERADISEETTRLSSHCEQFREQLNKREAVGRKLDFLLQEMNREANTIASKAAHLSIQHYAVEIKTELEKIREQVQNIE